MNKKQVLRTVIFMILVLCISIVLCDLFEIPNGQMTQRMETFKQQEKGTLDGVIIGSSGIDRYWIGAKAFEDYGMTVYPVSMENEPSWLTLVLVKEVVKRQDPKLVIIDARSFSMDEKNEFKLFDIRCHRVIDVLDFFSPTRLEAAMRSMEMIHEYDPESHSKFDISFLFSFVRFHSRWSDDDFSFSELEHKTSSYLGFECSKKTVRIEKQKMRAATEERLPLNSYSEKNLRELLDYLKENNINALFLSTPSNPKEEVLKRSNTIEDIITEAGFPCMMFNSTELRDVCNLDPDTDFYNDGHVNFYGAVKFTDYFAAYLNDQYHFADHRQEEVFSSWYGVYDTIQKRIAKYEKKVYGK